MVILRKLPELVAKVNVFPAVPLIWVEVVTKVDDASVTKPGFVQLNASWPVDVVMFRKLPELVAKVKILPRVPLI